MVLCLSKSYGRYHGAFCRLSPRVAAVKACIALGGRRMLKWSVPVSYRTLVGANQLGV